MVWGERSSNQPGLSYDAFLAIARQAGLDLSDREHLARLYEDTRGVLRGIVGLEAIDAGSAEPADVYTPGSEAR
ncbi:MAG: hypothetical protein FJ318_01125 [SAR202 cluster bacterium]|nr:hypothetical protein [SAR202 cluster bacterium]